MKVSRVYTVLAAGVVGLLLAASVAAGAEEKSRMDVVLERGKLIVVTLTTVPPFAFNDDKGQLVGFDIDIARLVATALFKDPNKVEFVSVSADGRRRHDDLSRPRDPRGVHAAIRGLRDLRARQQEERDQVAEGP